MSADPAFNAADRDAKGRGGGAKRRGGNNGSRTMPERLCRGAAWHAARPPEVLKLQGLKVKASLKRFNVRALKAALKRAVQK
jgi:hypothetical protein